MGDLLEQNLCSPRKIRRLEFRSVRTETSNPEKKGIRDSQGSQQSRATSTPTKLSKEKSLTLSSDISSIHPIPDALSEKSLVSESGQEDDDDDDEVVSTARSLLDELSLRETPSSYPGSSIDDLLEAPNRKLLKGKLWKFFKPKSEGTLYFKIFTDFDGIEKYAIDFLNKFQTNKWKATLTLIKFFIDLCGYQTVEIEDLFNCDEDSNISSKKVIKLMEFDLVDQELLDNKTNIFYESERGKSKLAAALAKAVQSFLEIFFMGAHAENLLFVDTLYKYVFNFLFHMCHSMLWTISHTALVLVRMLLTVFNYIYDKILKNSEDNYETDDEDLPAEKKKLYMERYLEYFFRLFAKNSFIPDPHFAILKANNVKEMGTWAIDLPQVYFVKCFELLIKLLLDESEVVRLSTLNVFESFFIKRSTRLYVTKYVKSMVRMVSDRLKDVSIKVVAAAVKLFTVLLDNYRQFIGTDEVCQISGLLYGNSYLYAKAAGAFLCKYFNYAYTDESRVLHKLVELSATPKFSKMKPLLVEGFSEYETVLRNYRFLVNYMLTCKEDESTEYTNNVMELIYYSVYQTLKGESAIKRKHSVQATPLPSAHENIAEVFQLNLKSLFELYQNEIVALNYMMKILCLIDFDVLTSSYHSQFLFLFNNCRQFLLKLNDDELLESICNFFKYLRFDKNNSLKEKKQLLLDNLFECMSTYLKGYLEYEDQEESLENHFKKIGKLYEKFNLNKYFEWNDLFVNWGRVLLCSGQITACTQFLIWSTEEIAKEVETGSDELRMKILNFKKIFSDYTTSLVSVLISHDTSDLKYKAFISLCDLYPSCDRILLGEREPDGVRFSILENLRKNLSEPLGKFFKKSIVFDRSLPLETRKKYISYWLNLIMNGIIDVLYIVPLFESYYIHSQDYNSLIDFVSTKVFAQNPQRFFNIILATLGGLTDELFLKGKKSISSPEAVQLMALAAKFANMKPFRQFSEEVLTFIHLGLNFAFKKELLQFLVVLQNFTPKLLKYRKQCLVILHKLTPPEYENHTYVKAFRMKLKSENIKVAGKANTIGEKTLASESEELIEPKLKKRKRYSIPKDRSNELDKETKSRKGKLDNKNKSPISEEDDDRENKSVKPKPQKKKGEKNFDKSKASKAKKTKAQNKK